MPGGGGPTPTMNDLLKDLYLLRDNVESCEGSAQQYLSTQQKADLDTAISDLVAETGEPEGYDPPEEPILDIGPAVGLLSGIKNAIGILYPSMPGAAGAFLQSIIDDLLNSIPH